VRNALWCSLWPPSTELRPCRVRKGEWRSFVVKSVENRSGTLNGSLKSTGLMHSHRFGRTACFWFLALMLVSLAFCNILLRTVLAACVSSFPWQWLFISNESPWKPRVSCRSHICCRIFNPCSRRSLALSLIQCGTKIFASRLSACFLLVSAVIVYPERLFDLKN
jgi:hypothetical protein